jgi:hypothetical protein
LRISRPREIGLPDESSDWEQLSMLLGTQCADLKKLLAKSGYVRSKA